VSKSFVATLAVVAAALTLPMHDVRAHGCHAGAQLDAAGWHHHGLHCRRIALPTYQPRR